MTDQFIAGVICKVRSFRRGSGIDAEEREGRRASYVSHSVLPTKSEIATANLISNRRKKKVEQGLHPELVGYMVFDKVFQQNGGGQSLLYTNDWFHYCEDLI